MPRENATGSSTHGVHDRVPRPAESPGTSSEPDSRLVQGAAGRPASGSPASGADRIRTQMEEIQKVPPKEEIKDETQEPSAEPRQVAWRRALEPFVDAAAGALQASLPAAQRDAFLDRLADHNDWRELGRLFSMERGSRAEVEGLRGPASMLVLQVREEIRKRVDQPESLRAFLSVTLARTLFRLEQEGDGTPETRVDMVLLGLATSMSPPWTPGLLRFTAGMRGYLELQPSEARGPGWYQTIAGLGDWIGRSRNPTALRHSAFFYHQVLSAGLQASPGRIHAVANNLAGRMDDLPGGKDPRCLRVCNRLHALSVTAALSEFEAAPQDDAVAERLWASLAGKTPAHPLKAAQVLLTMAHVPYSWRHLDAEVVGADIDHSDDWMVVIEAAAGALGCRLYGPEDHHRIAATLFNAGVSAHRYNPKESVLLRAVLNCLGLLWAMRKSGADPVRGLVEYNGLDCGVNLFGALADLRTARTMRTTQRLAALLVAQRPSLPREQQLEFLRLEGAWKELGFAPSRADASERDSLEASALALLDEVLGSDSWPTASLNAEADDEASLATAAIVRRVCHAEMGGAFDALMDDLLALADRVGAMSQDMQDTWNRLYGDLADKPSALGKGPLVAAGLMSEQEWIQLALEAVNTRVRSLAPLLSAENLDWLG